jgi:hypothetical protein
MSHGTEHHLEHAEHVQHQAHDPFDRRVAMTMAIVAAVLACVIMLSHRAHNKTLQLQIEANDNLTKASDQWGYFQAKKNRQYLYEATADLLGVTAKDPQNTDAGSQAAKRIEDWKNRAGEYSQDAKKIENEARELGRKADELHKEAEHIHHEADRFDYGELGIEIALVLCSVAILTKQRGFWLSGIVVGLVGAAAAVSGFFLGH